MEEPVRLVCSACETVYRVKNFSPEKAYSCKKCGSSLESMNEPTAAPDSPLTERTPQLLSSAPEKDGAASVSLKRLSVLTDTLAARLDALSDAESRSLEEGLAEVDARIDALAKDITRNLEEHAAILVEGSKVFAEGVSTLSSQIDLGRLGQLGVQIRETGDLFLRQLGEYRERQAGEIENIVKNTLADALKDHGPSSVIDQDALIASLTRTISERLESVAGDTLGLSEVNANLKEINTILAGLTQVIGLEDKLPDIVGDKVQSLVLQPIEHSLYKHIEEISRASASLKEATRRDLDIGAISRQIADEVAKSVESAVVVPVTNALVRQAPEILSQIQGDQLSDVVLKSVRDAQRPLLREVVNGRRGVPLWLFASLLLPLLLILGYLFADVLGLGGGEIQTERFNETISREMSRLTATGVPLTAEDSDRLRTMEGLLVNSENLMNTMYENAWAQVKSNGTLEAEVLNLRRSLEERDKLISEYNTSLQQQSKRIRAYEIQLTRLGISPDTVPNGE